MHAKRAVASPLCPRAAESRKAAPCMFVCTDSSMAHGAQQASETPAHLHLLELACGPDGLQLSCAAVLCELLLQPAHVAAHIWMGACRCCMQWRNPLKSSRRGCGSKWACWVHCCSQSEVLHAVADWVCCAGLPCIDRYYLSYMPVTVLLHTAIYMRAVS